MVRLVAMVVALVAGAPHAAPAPRAHGPLVAHLAGSVVLRAAPDGRALAVEGRRTEFGSPTALAVVRRRGRWLGVLSPTLRNGRIGWVDGRAAGLRLAPEPVRVAVDLSRRLLVVERGRRVLRRVRVAVGAAASPTPTGRFAVTDVLPGARFGPVYGCCILALTGRQTHTPAGWRDGDRLAIHGGAGLGSAVSAGCLHAAEANLRYLVQVVPPGALVTVHP